jgi:hypothetical protein
MILNTARHFTVAKFAKSTTSLLRMAVIARNVFTHGSAAAHIEMA